MSEDRDTSNLDLGLVMDSKEGGLEESEKVEDGVDEGGWESFLSRAPLPKHFGQVSGNH